MDWAVTALVLNPQLQSLGFRAHCTRLGIPEPPQLTCPTLELPEVFLGYVLHVRPKSKIWHMPLLLFTFQLPARPSLCCVDDHSLQLETSLSSQPVSMQPHWQHTLSSLVDPSFAAPFSPQAAHVIDNYSSHTQTQVPQPPVFPSGLLSAPLTPQLRISCAARCFLFVCCKIFVS